MDTLESSESLKSSNSNLFSSFFPNYCVFYKFWALSELFMCSAWLSTTAGVGDKFKSFYVNWLCNMLSLTRLVLRGSSIDTLLFFLYGFGALLLGSPVLNLSVGLYTLRPCWSLCVITILYLTLPNLTVSPIPMLCPWPGVNLCSLSACMCLITSHNFSPGLFFSSSLSSIVFLWYIQ